MSDPIDENERNAPVPDDLWGKRKSMVDLDEIERRALAAMPMGGGDIARLLDACSPETILALVRVAKAALADQNEVGQDLHDAIANLRTLTDSPESAESGYGSYRRNREDQFK